MPLQTKIMPSRQNFLSLGWRGRSFSSFSYFRRAFRHNCWDVSTSSTAMDANSCVLSECVDSVNTPRRRRTDELSMVWQDKICTTTKGRWVRGLSMILLGNKGKIVCPSASHQKTKIKTRSHWAPLSCAHCTQATSAVRIEPSFHFKWKQIVCTANETNKCQCPVKQPCWWVLLLAHVLCATFLTLELKTGRWLREAATAARASQYVTTSRGDKTRYQAELAQQIASKTQETRSIFAWQNQGPDTHLGGLTCDATNSGKKTAQVCSWAIRLTSA